MLIPVPKFRRSEKFHSLEENSVLHEVIADLHIHTCLSPCSSLDMSPVKIIKEAVKKGLSIIAVTDHNSAENTGALVNAAAGTGLYVIPGIEITTSEEIHIISLFPSLNDAFNIQELIFMHLQPGENKEDLFGMQVIANEYDEVEGMNRRLLIGATTLNVNDIISHIHLNNGIAIAAHIDRDSYSMVGQLGFIPDDSNIDCVEISKKTSIPEARKKFREYDKYPFITSSDAHELIDIGSSPTRIMLDHPDFNELIMALKGKDGRAIVI